MTQNMMTVLLVEDGASGVRLAERRPAKRPLRAEPAVESVGSLSEAIKCLTNR